MWVDVVAVLIACQVLTFGAVRLVEALSLVKILGTGRIGPLVFSKQATIRTVVPASVAARISPVSRGGVKSVRSKRAALADAFNDGLSSPPRWGRSFGCW